MINGKRVAVVMPAYNAEKTLQATVAEIPSLVDIKFWSMMAVRIAPWN